MHFCIRSIKGGSSPRAWGTPGGRCRGRAAERFIPTRVGNTSTPSPVRSCRTVHPHARGEHTSGATSHPGVTGSSPRAWGTLERRLAHVGQVRFIPTRVGNTSYQDKTQIQKTVHPHARGEHFFDCQHKEIHFGSSPRAWGTHSPPPALSSDIRFIPTRVGNTQQARQGLRD